ncbi:hypothetical protein [Micromonospora sp. NPDC005806]|uniref:hypothetical protein n=1 Tax=Micromonospora sp. NPDC005806 TaxID=3364234 RepID=UPI0036AECE64
MQRDHLGDVLFRSRDGGMLLARDIRGLLQELPATAGCTWRPDERHRTLAAELDRHGLWSHLPQEQRASARHDVATGCHPLDFDLLYGHIEFFADGETLAEGGVERFLSEIGPGLSRLGLLLDVVTVQSPYRSGQNDDYVINVNGVRCAVWTTEEWGDDGDLWAKATVRPLAVVNRLLAATTPVRAHTLYTGGNEALLLLIQPGVPAAMRMSGLFPEREIPALAQ